MTEMKRKLGPGNPQEEGKIERLLSKREKGSERLERPKRQREKEDKSSAGVDRKRSTFLHCDLDFAAYNTTVLKSLENYLIFITTITSIHTHAVVDFLWIFFCHIGLIPVGAPHQHNPIAQLTSKCQALSLFKLQLTRIKPGTCPL